jgi:3-oxoisoapionate kinase
MTVPNAPLPDGLLLAFYGDDFTGSTDALEVLSFAGVETVLFLEEPTSERLAQFPNARAVGLAGVSRSRDPDWMEARLGAHFTALARLGAPILHYKVCSTFDSAPHLGSIGKAIDLGVPFGRSRFTPVIVGAPRLRRYQAFGNLFAAHDGTGYRLDRHPTMATHPATPMHEADLRFHLKQQTSRRIDLIDFVALKQGHAEARLAALADADVPIVLVDVLDDATLQAAGRLVWENRSERLFTASSSGLQYALVAHWRATGLLGEETVPGPAPGVDRIAVVSGSCSPTTAAQIAWGRSNGFEPIRLDAARTVGDDAAAEAARCASEALSAIGRGLDPLVFSAEGPADAALEEVDAAIQSRNLKPGEAARLIGGALADVMRQILTAIPLRRIAVAGGDTSGDVASGLGIFALTALAPLAPGSPLCRCWSDQPGRSGLEIALKGGQVGSPSFFGAVRAGAPLA